MNGRARGAGEHCPSCHDPFTYKDIAGGRCLSCQSAITPVKYRLDVTNVFHDEDDDGTNGKWRWSIVTSFEEWEHFATMNCNDIGAMVNLHKVFRPSGACMYDHESSCCYWYFSRREGAYAFVERFNTFMDKREAIAKKWGFNG